MDNFKDRVTIYEVAKASGVSLATVSRVINKQSNVTQATRDKVNATIARLGYKPSALAQALATNRTTNIGVIIPSANYVYIANLLYGLTEVARANGFLISLFVTSHNKEEANRMLEKVITTHVDGAIIFDDELDEHDIAKVSSYNVPTIVINNNITDEKVGCVYFGYEHLLKKIVAAVLTREKNKKDVTFLHMENGGRLLSRMEKAFYEVHELLNKKAYSIMTDDSYTRTYDYFKRYFKTHRNPGYFIAYRDSLAKAVINAAKDNDLKVPQDIEVLSIIGTKYAHIMSPTISSMHIDMIEVGKTAVNMLSALIKHNLTEKAHKFESVYEKRESTLD
ncbi:MAG: LacI family transcriptional regulator [Bacilli bacterium]|nr:LacI family transcriptional regulator [Bacilli bacterium]